MVIGITLIGCITGPFAQTRNFPEDIYTVRGISVDERAVTASQARDLALNKGQRLGWHRLLHRIVMTVDFPDLPELSDQNISSMVQGIEIKGERASSVRYLSDLTIHFNKIQVRDWLRTIGIPFTETLHKPVIVVPVYQAAGVTLLWDDPNPWADAWHVHDNDPDNLLPFIIPQGSLSDLAIVNAHQATSGEERRLNALARAYGVEDVIVAHATLHIDLISDRTQLVVATRRFGTFGAGGLVIESFVGKSRAVVNSLLSEAAASISHRLQEEWKRETLVRFNQPVRLSATVSLANLGTWITVRSLLLSSSLIRDVELVSISRVEAQVVLHYLGDPNKLIIELAQRDLKLSHDQEGFWMLGSNIE